MTRFRIRFRKCLAGLGLAFALLWAVNWGLSALVGGKRVSRILTARLETTFGRPVQVRHFHFSLWDGPRIEADSVTVGEDPRFGHEYFLRAGQLTATLRLRSLLGGRAELGSFALSDASLNVVNVGGEWNLADWLPPAAPGRPGRRAGAPRLYRIEIQDGRINFKRGTVKLPFALVDVNGSVDETAPGRWSLSLGAQPMRVAVTLQDAGTLHLVGQVGGTSARLRPARLQLRWQDASISDVLRLFFGDDYGIRGHQNVDLQASSSGTEWRFVLNASAGGLRAWNFAAQPGNPAVNVRLSGSWSPGEGKLTVASGQVKGPASTVTVKGGLDWPVARLADSAGPPPGPRFHLHLSTGGIGVQDLLSWYRSFHQAIPASLRATGWLEGSADIDGWPPRIRRAAISAAGLSAEGGALAGPVKLGAAKLQASERHATLLLSGLDFGLRAGQFRVVGRARRDRRWVYQLEASGASPQVGDLVAALEALGARTPAYWNEFSGGGKIEIEWAGTIPFSGQTMLASVALRNAAWREPSLPAQVRFQSALVHASGDGLRFDIRSADALGAVWHGWLERRQPSGAWRFALEANRLHARTLVARLRPQKQRPSLLERIFGFGHAAGSPPLWPASLNASGTMRVNRLSIAPLAIDGVRSRVAIHDGALDISAAHARFYGGYAQGSLSFRVAKGVPVWRMGTRLAGVDLSRLSRAFAGAKKRFSGLASGDLRISAHGATARLLRDSLEGQARISIRGARYNGIDWIATLKAGHPVPGHSTFASCSAQIGLTSGKLTLQDLSAVSPRGRIEATGSIDLAQGEILAVEARFFPSPDFAAPGGNLETRTYEVTGSSIDPLIRFLHSADTSPLPTSSH
ncbi:MAG TPA: AsmA-like C-terminal region-containing protein [Patescibacteria group bacterium]|nr:AsmA-like C-terminal region-containing protein [Patescibacteria group bacterium]